jgi:hypothetical protein
MNSLSVGHAEADEIIQGTGDAVGIPEDGFEFLRESRPRTHLRRSMPLLDVSTEVTLSCSREMLNGVDYF